MFVGNSHSDILFHPRKATKEKNEGNETKAHVMLIDKSGSCINASTLLVSPFSLSA